MDISGELTSLLALQENAFVFLFKEAVVPGHIFFLVHLKEISPYRCHPHPQNGAILHFGGALNWCDMAEETLGDQLITSN